MAASPRTTESPEPRGTVPRPGGRAWGRSEGLVLLVGVLALLHHIDHALRADHSGWPFMREPTPYTFSLLVYLVLFGIVRARRRPWLRIVAVAVVFFFLQSAHIVAETPRDQFAVWATGASIEPETLGQRNLLGVRSRALGYVAVTVSLALSAALVATLVSLIADAIRGTPRRARGVGRRAG